MLIFCSKMWITLWIKIINGGFLDLLLQKLAAFVKGVLGFEVPGRLDMTNVRGKSAQVFAT
jgi:hypothetical protein